MRSNQPKQSQLLLGMLHRCSKNEQTCTLSKKRGGCFKVFIEQRKADVLSNIRRATVRCQQCKVKPQRKLDRVFFTLIMSMMDRLADHGFKNVKTSRLQKRKLYTPQRKSELPKCPWILRNSKLLTSNVLDLACKKLLTLYVLEKLSM